LDGFAVARIDPRANVADLVVGTPGEVFDLAADGDSLWFVEGGDPETSPNHPVNRLVEIRADGSVEHSYRLPEGFTTGGIVIAVGSIWISSLHDPE
jgi:hypothetical protein